VLRNWFALAEQDNVGENNVQCDVDHDGEPDAHAVPSRKSDLQHESADTELEYRHCRQVEVLAEPKVHLILSKHLFRDERVVNVSAGTDPSCHVTKACSSEAADLLAISMGSMR
jgi:hypothetical protein